MTDQRTLKRIIGEQRGIIEKQKVVLDELNENYLKLNSTFETSDKMLGEANDELEHYREENWDQTYEIAFLREDLTDINKILIDALDRAKLEPQPQDMKMRITFTFDESQGLERALRFIRKISQDETVQIPLKESQK
jgi:hypothetical protein